MTQLIVDLNALAHNYHQLRKPLPQSTKMIGVVKANAYGFGAIEIAKQLITLGCEYLAVAYAEEGIELRSAGIEAPIMVFYPLRENTDRLVQYRLEPALYSTAFIKAFKTTVEAHGLEDYPVHLKCNTGLNRIGLSGNEVNDFLDQLPLLPFQLCSVYSHLAASENEQPCTLTSKQIDQFKELQSRIKLKVEATPFFHLLNSSGCFNYPDAHFDAVRTGIALYGFANRNDWDQTLIPIASLSTPIVQTHTIKKGGKCRLQPRMDCSKRQSNCCFTLGTCRWDPKSFGTRKRWGLDSQPMGSHSWECLHGPFNGGHQRS